MRTRVYCDPYWAPTVLVTTIYDPAHKCRMTAQASWTCTVSETVIAVKPLRLQLAARGLIWVEHLSPEGEGHS